MKKFLFKKHLVAILVFIFTLSFLQSVFANENEEVDDYGGHYDWAVKLNMPFEEGNEVIDGTTNSFDIIAQYVSMIYKWWVVVTGLLAVLMLAVGGVQYMLYGADPWQKDDAKERIQKALLALVLLLMSGLILKTINPNFFHF